MARVKARARIGPVCSVAGRCMYESLIEFTTPPVVLVVRRIGNDEF